jgi:hypothetical protein
MWEEIGRVPHVRTSVRGTKTMAQPNNRFKSSQPSLTQHKIVAPNEAQMTILR